jgi:hypothetical protein
MEMFFHSFVNFLLKKVTWLSVRLRPAGDDADRPGAQDQTDIPSGKQDSG